MKTSEEQIKKEKPPAGLSLSSSEIGKRRALSFSGQSETEIVLAAYDKWGEEFVTHHE